MAYIARFELVVRETQNLSLMPYLSAKKFTSRCVILTIRGRHIGDNDIPSSSIGRQVVTRRRTSVEDQSDDLTRLELIRESIPIFMGPSLNDDRRSLWSFVPCYGRCK